MKIPKDFKFIGPRPYQHQIETFSFCRNRKNSGILLEPGLGKTKCAIDIARYKLQKKEINKILIICPTSVLILWDREIKKFAEQEAIVLYGAKEDRIYLLKHNRDKKFFIINYEMLFPLLNHLAKYKFDMLVFDESARYIKNPQAKRTKAAILLADQAKTKLILTGTPIANKPLDVWAQFRVLNGGDILGCNFYSFRSKYFRKIKRKSRKGIYYDFKIKPNGISIISNAISENCIRKKKEDCFDLPEKIYSIIELKLERTLKDIYYSIQEEVINSINTIAGDAKFNIRSIFTKLLKLQQVTSGFIKDEKGKENELRYTPKLDALIEEIKTIVDAEESVIVWCRFLKSISMIENRLKKEKIECITMQGRDKDKDTRWRTYQTSNIPVFISQIQAGGIGIELFKENSTAKNQHTIFYENVWSLDWRIQAEDRCLTENNLIICEGENRGIKSIKDVEIGDYVLGKSGKWCKVIDKWKRTNINTPITKIQYIGWPEGIECTYDHKFLTERNSNIEWREAHNLLPGDYSLMKIPYFTEEKLKYIEVKEDWKIFKNQPKHCIVDKCTDKIEARSMCSKHYREYLRKTPESEREKIKYYNNGRYKPLPKIIEINNDWLFTFGQYLANGFSSTDSKKSSFVSISGDLYKLKFLERCGRTFSSIGINYNIYKSKASNGLELRAYSRELALWFSSWLTTGAHNKKIPEELMSLNKEQSWTLLMGYIKGDGYERKNQVEWTSVSSTLAYQACLLAMKCGYNPTFRKCVTDKVTVFIGGFSYTNKIKDGWVKHKIRKVETYFYKRTPPKRKRQYLYDITVEKDESFVTGFITAHNCHRIGQTSTCIYKDIILEKTIDEKILRTIKQRKEIANIIMREGVDTWLTK